MSSGFGISQNLSAQRLGNRGPDAKDIMDNLMIHRHRIYCDFIALPPCLCLYMSRFPNQSCIELSWEFGKSPVGCK